MHLFSVNVMIYFFIFKTKLVTLQAMLSFDQFVYKLSEDIYSYYRLLASMLVKKYLAIFKFIGI